MNRSNPKISYVPVPEKLRLAVRTGHARNGRKYKNPILRFVIALLGTNRSVLSSLEHRKKVQLKQLRHSDSVLLEVLSFRILL